jgi:hypothetical protein
LAVPLLNISSGVQRPFCRQLCFLNIFHVLNITVMYMLPATLYVLSLTSILHSLHTRINSHSVNTFLKFITKF